MVRRNEQIDGSLLANDSLKQARFDLRCDLYKWRGRIMRGNGDFGDAKLKYAVSRFARTDAIVNEISGDDCHHSFLKLDGGT